MADRMYRLLFIVLLTSGIALAHADGVRDLDLKLPPADAGSADEGATSVEGFEWMKDERETITDRCERLRIKIDELKGKPQRRWAAKQYYEDYCQQYFDQHKAY